MGTQKAIAAQIVDQQADYVLALKGNQGTLHEAQRSLTIDKPDADHSNSGTINVTGGNLVVNNRAPLPASPIRVQFTSALSEALQ